MSTYKIFHIPTASYLVGFVATPDFYYVFQEGYDLNYANWEEWKNRNEYKIVTADSKIKAIKILNDYIKSIRNLVLTAEEKKLSKLYTNKKLFEIVKVEKGNINV